MKKEAGFTLVEIAIVLVVIGLLLGAILAGQEVVLNGQIRNTINEYNNVASAVFVYQDRYRQIPGDDVQAAIRWGATVVSPAAGAGGGNRRIDGLWNAGANNAEPGIFWHHLRNDDLVAGPKPAATPNQASFALPPNAFNGLIGVQDGAFNHTTPIPGRVICQSNIPFRAAIIIDTRIDDDPGSGTGSATGSLQGSGAALPATNGPAAGAYSPATPELVLCRELG